MELYFLIAYDISDKKRLSKVAKILEQKAMRIQKSLYFYQTNNSDKLKNLVKIINENISNEDDVRIYKIDINSSLAINSAINLKTSNIIGVNYADNI